MITPEEIAERARKLYPAWLQAWLRNEPFFPTSLPVGQLPAEYAQLREAVGRLRRGEKATGGHGYTLELETVQTRRFGAQSLPRRVIIAGPQDLLALADKAGEFTAFCADVAAIRERLPQLEAWLAANAARVVAYHGAWPELLRVCAHMLAHPRPGVFARELPITVHTKFVEQHSDVLRRLLDALLPAEAILPGASSFEARFGLRAKEPALRARFLDGQLRVRYNLPLSELSAPPSEFAQLQLSGDHCLIVENELTFLTLPPLADSFAIFGKGFNVELLAGLPWLADGPMSYWGDLDAQGFQILAQLRARFPHAVSLMMDRATLDAFAAFQVIGTPCAARALPQLSAVEHALFVELAERQCRLEQERISYSYATAQLLARVQRLRAGA